MLDWVRKVRCAGVLCLLAVAVAQGAEEPLTLPNVVIILLDDMGYGDSGCYNPQSRIETPHIDSLARSGMRFTDAHAAGPLCHPSRYGLMTGRYPWRTDVSVWPTKALIREDQATIASVLKQQGYRTAMVGKWHCGFNENGYDKPLPGGPVDCGFDTFFGMRASTDIPPYFYIRGNRAVLEPTDHIEASSSPDWLKYQGEFWREGGISPDLKLEEVLPRFTDEALGVIRQHAESDEAAVRPLMLYLAYPAPHTPWLPGETFRGKSKAGLYGDFVMQVDAEIGRVLEGLKQSGMERNTLLLFTSDNGPVWYDGNVAKFGHDAMGPLRGMKADIHEAGHRIPFIVRWPETVEAGSCSSRIICFTDLLATLAELTGYELQPGEGPDSFSFLPVLRGEGKNETRPPLVLESGFRNVRMIRSGDWKLIDQLGSGGFTKPVRIRPEPGGPKGQLYNLAEDLGETENLYLKYPEKTGELIRELNRIVTGASQRALCPGK
jgi:arylsulfatase A